MDQCSSVTMFKKKKMIVIFEFRKYNIVDMRTIYVWRADEKYLCCHYTTYYIFFCIFSFKNFYEKCVDILKHVSI